MPKTAFRYDSTSCMTCDGGRDCGCGIPELSPAASPCGAVAWAGGIMLIFTFPLSWGLGAQVTSSIGMGRSSHVVGCCRRMFTRLWANRGILLSARYSILPLVPNGPCERTSTLSLNGAASKLIVSTAPRMVVEGVPLLESEPRKFFGAVLPIHLIPPVEEV